MLLLALTLLAGCASPDGGRDVWGIRNSRWVSRRDAIAVSAQPSFEDFAGLQSRGVSNVICFNHRSEVVPGMTVHCYYISTLRQIFGGQAMADQYAAALAEVTPGTIVHCTHGANRSGAFYIALLMRDGMPKDEAIALANRYGYASSFPGTKRWVRNLK